VIWRIIKSIIIGTRKIHLSKAVWFNVIFACNGIDWDNEGYF
jgi:hypothetical protein